MDMAVMKFTNLDRASRIWPATGFETSVGFWCNSWPPSIH